MTTTTERRRTARATMRVRTEQESCRLAPGVPIVTRPLIPRHAPGTMLFKTGRGTMVPSEDSEGYDSGTFMQYFRTAKPGGEGKGGEPASSSSGGGGSEGALQRFGPKAGSTTRTEDSEWWAGTMKLAHSVSRPRLSPATCARPRSHSLTLLPAVQVLGSTTEELEQQLKELDAQYHHDVQALHDAYQERRRQIVAAMGSSTESRAFV